MKGKMNPPLEVNDVVICYYMEGETSVPPGTKGVVKKVGKDPFEPDGQIIEVKWENGSTLNLLSVTDYWKKESKKDINEQIRNTGDPQFDLLINNEDMFRNFDYKWFRNYLEVLRKSGIINMFGAAPLLYSGAEHINRYYGEDQEDNSYFQELLEMAEESKSKIINGIIKYMESTNQDVTNIDLVNRFATKFSRTLLTYFMNFGPIN